jgi:hypothetical protein
MLVTNNSANVASNIFLFTVLKPPHQKC